MNYCGKMFTNLTHILKSDVLKGDADQWEKEMKYVEQLSKILSIQ